MGGITLVLVLLFGILTSIERNKCVHASIQTFGNFWSGKKCVPIFSFFSFLSLFSLFLRFSLSLSLSRN